MKGKPELDSVLNIVWLNRKCHDRVEKNWRYYRKFFWDMKVKKHGGLMYEWFQFLPLAGKDAFFNV
jgi:hypothetical protein